MRCIFVSLTVTHLLITWLVNGHIKGIASAICKLHPVKAPCLRTSPTVDQNRCPHNPDTTIRKHKMHSIFNNDEWLQEFLFHSSLHNKQWPNTVVTGIIWNAEQSNRYREVSQTQCMCDSQMQCVTIMLSNQVLQRKVNNSQM